jgi:hypothetical protein
MKIEQDIKSLKPLNIFGNHLKDYSLFNVVAGLILANVSVR